MSLSQFELTYPRSAPPDADQQLGYRPQYTDALRAGIEGTFKSHGVPALWRVGSLTIVTAAELNRYIAARVDTQNRSIRPDSAVSNLANAAYNSGSPCVELNPTIGLVGVPTADGGTVTDVELRARNPWREPGHQITRVRKALAGIMGTDAVRDYAPAGASEQPEISFPLLRVELGLSDAREVIEEVVGETGGWIVIPHQISLDAPSFHNTGPHLSPD